ncbi:MAG: site-specific DNA-methyltransferase [Methylococcaceae bacterium]
MNENTLQSKMPNTPDGQQERLQEFKRLFPDLFDDEGQLKLDDLKQLAGDLSQHKERYDFTWSGKRNAKQAAYSPTTAALTYDETRSVNPDQANGNLIIEGENLESLKCLLAAYRGAVKCIYIDPPYNTGKDFVYSDNYNEQRKAYWQQTGGVEAGIKVDTNPDSDGRYHSNWLNMIYPRLLLARQLLKDDGVIFVSIDDNEVHNLRKVMDEVFGEENFLACVCWQKKYAPSNDTEDFSPMHDFIVVYCKERKYTASGKVIGILRRLDRTVEQNKLYKNPDNDPRGIWASDNYLCNKTAEQRPNLYYPIIHPKSGEEIWPNRSSVWRYSKERHELNVRENRIWWGAKQENAVPRYKRFISDVSGVISTTWWTHQDAGHNDEAKKESRNLLSDIGVDFDTPKPVRLIKRILKLATSPGEKPDSALLGINDMTATYEVKGQVETQINEKEIVLDFFAGSGTTAQAVLELNKEDNGHRQFILVQLPEQIKTTTPTNKADFKKISDITIERVKRVINGYGDNPQPLEAGFKAYQLTKSHFPRVDFKPDPEISDAENLQRLETYITEKEAQLIGLFEPHEIRDEVLLKNGFRLNYRLQEQPQFTTNTLSLIDDGEKSALICLDNTLTHKTVDQLLQNPQAFICLERALNTDAKWNLRQHLKHLFIAF